MFEIPTVGQSTKTSITKNLKKFLIW